MKVVVGVVRVVGHVWGWCLVKWLHVLCKDDAYHAYDMHGLCINMNTVLKNKNAHYAGVMGSGGTVTTGFGGRFDKSEAKRS